MRHRIGPRPVIPPNGDMTPAPHPRRLEWFRRKVSELGKAISKLPPDRADLAAELLTKREYHGAAKRTPRRAVAGNRGDE